jgi:hypothetical protein
MKNAIKRLKKASKRFPRAKNLLRWEQAQAYGNYKRGVAVGLILGAALVAILTIILIGILN